MKHVLLIPASHPVQKNLILNFRKTTNGWKKINPIEQQNYISRAKEIVFLGMCKQDGDMFSLHTHDGFIMIFKGELNSGTY